MAGAAFFGASSASLTMEKGVRSNKAPQNFVDSHVHVWTDDFAKYPLAKGFTINDMNPPRFLPAEILQLGKSSDVNRVVLVQMSYYGFDNSFMLDTIRKWPKTFRGIAVVDSNEKAPDEIMRDLAKHGVRGFRIYPQEVSNPTTFNGEGVETMFRCAAAEGLAICLLVNLDALPAVDRQCQRFPDTPVVIDHLARIGMGGIIHESDVAALCALSRHPHVKVKVSAFYALGKAKPPHLDLAPFIKRVFEAFGARRLMWGSDCPFQTVKESYEDSISLVRDRLDFLTREDKDWILRRTAAELLFK